MFESFRIVEGCPEYYEQLFTSGFLNHQLFRLINHGVRDDGLLNLTGTDFYSCLLPVPPLREQERIVDLLSICDSMISRYEEKAEQYRTLKQYLLGKMFPAEGTAVPEIRFPGFTDTWEPRKCKDVAPLQRGFDLPVSQMQDGKYPVVMSNGIGGYHSEYKAIGPGIVTGRSGTIGKLHYIKDDYWPHNTALWVTDFKGNYPKFIYYLYQKLDLSRFGSGSGVPTLNRNDVHDAYVSIPALEEQKRISELLTDIDNTITLHQCEAEAWKTKKKALAQLLLTGIVRV